MAKVRNSKKNSEKAVSTIPFGVGCFHFGIKEEPPFDFKGAEYLKELDTLLRSISSVDDVNIQSSEEFETASGEITEELPNLEEGHRPFPYPDYMTVEFLLHIPFRIQEELIKETRSAFRVETATETFRVIIDYSYFSPVAFVELVDPNPTADYVSPSQGVFIVREFIRRQVEKVGSNYLRFECLGPSPFHTDFHVRLREAAGEDMKFEVKRIPSRGYDEVIFHYNPTVFTDVKDAWNNLHNDIGHELGLFYKIVRFRVAEMYRWYEVQTLIEKIVEAGKLRGVGGFLKKTFLMGSSVTKTFFSLIDFEIVCMSNRNTIESDCRSVYSEGVVVYLQSYIDKKVKDQPTYPTKHAREILSLSESRRVKTIDVIVALVAALIGGMVGALLAK